MGIYSLSSNPFIIAINEVYFGETKDIKELQRCFSEFRAELFESKENMLRGNILKSKIKFNRQMEKTFGFKNVDFTIDYKETYYPNAYTMPITFDMDVIIPKNHFSPTKDGMRYADKYTCVIAVTYALIMNKGYNDRELLAIILHEVGHNFYSVLINGGAICSGIRKSIIITDIVIDILMSAHPEDIYTLPISMALLTNKFKEIRHEITNKYPWFFNFVDNMKYLVSFILQLSSQFNILKLLLKPIKLIHTIIYNIFLRYNPLRILKGIFGYKDEKISDSFATMYGYGADLSSANTKLTMSKFNEDKTGVSGLIDNVVTLITLPITILSAPVEEHPSTASRVKSSLEYLEKELSSNGLDPKMEKEIKKQIKEINELLDTGFNKVDNDNILKSGYIRRMYSMWVYNFFGGDLREYISKNPHDEIEKNYMAKVKIK